MMKFMQFYFRTISLIDIVNISFQMIHQGVITSLKNFNSSFPLLNDIARETKAIDLINSSKFHGQELMIRNGYIHIFPKE